MEQLIFFFQFHSPIINQTFHVTQFELLAVSLYKTSKQSHMYTYRRQEQLHYKSNVLQLIPRAY